ncbi:MAG: hypothetical protein ACE15C_04095 [Phycisphaerae bacterium]
MKPSVMVMFDGRWRVARAAEGQVDARDLGAADGEAIAALKAALAEWGCREGVCLALPSSMVLAARVNCRDLPRHNRRNAMLCLLEEQLPLDIEGMTADFLPPSDGWALGAAVESAKARELVDKLQGAGIEVAAISPAALLALWQACREGPPCDFAMVASDAGVDVFRMKEGVPAAWYTVADDNDELLQCVKADQLSDPITGRKPGVCLAGRKEWPAEIVGGADLSIVHRDDEPCEAAAARAAGELLAGNNAGWINLRRDSLAMTNPWMAAGRQVRVAIALVLLLPLVLSAAMLWRGVQYDRAADRAYQEEVAAWRKLNPNRPVPAGLNRRLKSDLARLAGISGATDESPARANAMETLRRIIAGLPPSVRVRILDVRIGQSDVWIEGETRTHADAETINRALISAGMDMQAPLTENLPSGGVTFVLSGSPPGPRKASPGTLDVAADAPEPDSQAEGSVAAQPTSHPEASP